MQPPATPQQSPDEIRRSNKKKLVWGLTCLLGPTLLLVGTLLLYALINFIFATTTPETTITCPSGPDSITMGACATENIDQTVADGMNGPVKTIMNIIMFLVGAISVATWLPGIIGGIVLLATRKPVPPAQG